MVPPGFYRTSRAIKKPDPLPWSDVLSRVRHKSCCAAVSQTGRGPGRIESREPVSPDFGKQLFGPGVELRNICGILDVSVQPFCLTPCFWTKYGPDLLISKISNI